MNDEKYILIPYDGWLEKYKPTEHQISNLQQKLDQSSVRVDINATTYSFGTSARIGVINIHTHKGFSLDIDEAALNNVINTTVYHAIHSFSHPVISVKQAEELIAKMNEAEERNRQTLLKIDRLPRIVKFIFGL